MKLVIAEKPSVAQSLAAVLGAKERGQGYLQGNGYVVSWCVGHLIGLAAADAYDARYSKWCYEDLPIIPEEWKYTVAPDKKDQYEVLVSLMNRPDVESLVCATDAGREGELIFRLVYDHAGCTKPFERLWISSMEDSAIREGFENLRPGAEYDLLYEAALCRAKADWLVGISGTRLFSTLYRKTLNIGRVMTPTLALVVDRETAISDFKKEKFYTVVLDCGKFTAASERCENRKAADHLSAACSTQAAVVQSVEKKAILREQIDQVIDGIEEAKAQNGERYTIKQLEKSRKSLQAKLEKLNDQSRKDDVVTFEELGVDKLFVDEAHGFKNLFLTTKMRNVAGIGQSEAQKSSDMFAKCRYLDDLTGGKGVVFATGTPVSNSMVELYTMMRYLQYDLLKETGLDHFDSWAAAFGETVTALELAPEGGGFRAKTRFAKFFNLPELMAMWKEAADIQTAEMLKLPVPASENITVVTKPSEFQKELVAELGERAEDVRNRLVEPREDNMLKITSDGRKLALDQRLAYPELPDDPESKVNACVGNVLKVWRDTEPQKGAQLVFCDLSTPHGDGSFNVYDDIKQKLMAQGVPPEQIAFIHDAKTDVQKAELFSKVRKGQVRVLLGSTSKMGAGTNVQTRLAALHHLDCPWRPADIEQREGRILRQGNQFKSVKIFKYVTEGTFDAYNWGLIENKQKFIGQLMSGKNPSRSCEDVDEAALSYAEVKALASGDPRIMEKTELDGQVTKLKLLKANHESQRYALEDNLIKFYPQAIKREQETIADLETDIRHLEAHTPPDKEHFSMTVMGTTYTEKKEAGQAIIAAFESLKDLSDKVELGEYRGFPMTLWVSDSGLSPKLQITLKHTRSHTFEPGSDPFGNITRMDNVLEGMRDNLEQHQTVLGNLLQQMEDAKVEVKRPFPQEAELAEKSERLAALNVALNIGGKDKPNSRERQKHDGKTSIKRLLRRMGVESAASAAPKKDKEMEVAI